MVFMHSKSMLLLYVMLIVGLFYLHFSSIPETFHVVADRLVGHIRVNKSGLYGDMP